MLAEKLLPVVKAAPSDPYFYDVTMLLTGNGTNGAQNNTFLDSSSNAFSVSRSGNSTQGSFSPYGSSWSGYFNGATPDYLTVANNSAFILGSTWSIEAWVNPSVISGTQTIIGKWYNATANGSYLLYISNSYIKGGVYPNYNNDSGLSPIAGQWNHIVMTCDGTYIRFFLNGQLGTVASGVATSISADNGLALSIGNNATGSAPLTGYISNVRLTKNAIPTTYQTSSTTFGAQIFTPPASPLTTTSQGASSVSLLTCQSNRFIDNSSNAFAITTSGSPSVQRFSPFNPTSAYDTATIGGSGYFGGVTDWLQATNSLNVASAFTIEGWFYATDKTTTQGIFGCSGSYTGSTGVSLFIDSGNLYWWYNGTGSTTSTAINANCWNHFAYVSNGTTLYGYLNGVLVGSKVITPTSANNYITVGAVVNGVTWNNNYPFFGYISGFRTATSQLYSGSTYTVPTAPPTAVATTNLLLNYTNAGIPDSAMMNDLQTAGNAQVSTSVKKYGTGSLAFDGTGDYLLTKQTPNVDMSSGNFTIECWFYQTAKSAAYVPIISGTTGSFNFPIILDYGGSGYVGFYLSDGTSGNSGVSSFSLNTWTHVACTRSGTTVRVFINGTQVATNTSSAQVLVDCFGGWNGGGNDYLLKGYIDDLRITKGYARYTTNFTPPTAAFPTY